MRLCRTAHAILLTEPAKSELLLLLLLLPLLPTLLLLKPLLLLTSQMATLGLTQRLRNLNPKTAQTSKSPKTQNPDLTIPKKITKKATFPGPPIQLFPTCPGNISPMSRQHFPVLLGPLGAPGPPPRA